MCPRSAVVAAEFEPGFMFGGKIAFLTVLLQREKGKKEARRPKARSFELPRTKIRPSQLPWALLVWSTGGWS